MSKQSQNLRDLIASVLDETGVDPVLRVGFTLGDGTSGTDGSSGSSGVNGTSGINGLSGSTGSNGTNGTSGSSGVNGTSGSSGVNGTSGSSGVNGTSGISIQLSGGTGVTITGSGTVEDPYVFSV